MLIEIIFFNGCPNVDTTRKVLREAMATMNLEAGWKEWSKQDPGIPEYVTMYGSPTILIDSVDVAGLAPSEGADSCRVYDHGDGKLRGVPSVEMILRALKEAGEK